MRRKGEENKGKQIEEKKGGTGGRKDGRKEERKEGWANFRGKKKNLPSLK